MNQLFLQLMTHNMTPNRTLAPDIKDAVEFDVQLKPYHSYTLDNGTTVYSIDAGAEEVVMVELVFFCRKLARTKKHCSSHYQSFIKKWYEQKRCICH